MPYWRLFYHIVWATKDRQPLLDQQADGIVRTSLRTTLRAFNAIPHAIGTMKDHVHVAVSIPPSTPISNVVARMKGASAHAVNEANGNHLFAWQAEYGVLSFGERSLAEVVAYVEHQAARHAANELFTGLERIDDRPQPASAGLFGSARGLQPGAIDDAEGS